MSEGALIFTGDIDFRTGSNASITTPKSFATRSDVGGAKTILITNGDNHLKRVVGVNQFVRAASLTKITGFTEDRNKKFTVIAQTDDVSAFEYPYPGTASTYINQNSLTNGRPTYATGTGLIIRWNGSNWELHNENTNVTSAIHTDDTIVPFIELDGNRRTDFFGYSYATGLIGSQVKFEFLLPRYQSIIVEKDSTDKIYIQKSVLSGEGVSTDTDGTNVVVTPIDRTYENARGRIKPLGKAVAAAGENNKTNLNNATCFVAASSTTDDTSSGRHLVITNSAGVIQSQLGIPGYTYMKIRKNATDMVYIEEALQLDGTPTANDQSIAEEAFVNIKLTPCAILD